MDDLVIAGILGGTVLGLASFAVRRIRARHLREDVRQQQLTRAFVRAAGNREAALRDMTAGRRDIRAASVAQS